MTIDNIIKEYIAKLDIQEIKAGEANDRWTKEGIAQQITDNLKKDCKDSLLDMARTMPIKQAMNEHRAIPSKVIGAIWN